MLTGNKNFQGIVQKRYQFLLFILLGFLSSCSVIDVQKSASFSSSEQWAILPFQNNSLTPRAGEQVEPILATLLRIQGITNLKIYQQQAQSEEKHQWAEFDDRKYQESALLLAAKDNVSYAITGSVEEWQYKHGVGSEPAVGLTIWIIEVASGDVVWSASGARSGWSTESLSGTAQKLIKDLVSRLKINEI